MSIKVWLKLARTKLCWILKECGSLHSHNSCIIPLTFSSWDSSTRSRAHKEFEEIDRWSTPTIVCPSTPCVKSKDPTLKSSSTQILVKKSCLRHRLIAHIPACIWRLRHEPMILIGTSCQPQNKLSYMFFFSESIFEGRPAFLGMRTT
jgi:hypothetical protein